MGCQSCNHNHLGHVSCVVSDRGRFYALYVNDRLFRQDTVTIKRISRERYNTLRRRGVKRCRVV